LKTFLLVKFVTFRTETEVIYWNKGKQVQNANLGIDAPNWYH